MSSRYWEGFGKMACYGLTENPFNLLKVSIRSSRDDIAEAYEDALDDGVHDEDLLLQSHQALLGPKSRLEAELSWLPDCSPSRANRIMEGLSGNSTVANLIIEVADIEGLSAANVYASICKRSPGNRSVIEFLIRSYDVFSEKQTISALNENRQISGFPKANRELVSGLLPGTKEQHARAAVGSIIKSEHPSLLMTELVEDFLNKSGGARDFLEVVAFHYDTWSAPKLREIKDQIDQSVEILRADSAANQPVLDIARFLSDWDEYSQPAQLLEQEKGLDEQRSKDLYDELRDISLWLANEEGEFKSALAISKALLDTFPELPSVVIQASDDIDALETLVKDATSVELLTPLLSIVERCVSDLDAFDSDLIRNGFSQDGRGLAKTLYEIFSEAVEKTRGTEHEDMPWMVVRGIAIELNNSGEATEGALNILEGLDEFSGGTPSFEVKAQINIDLSTIRSNLKFNELLRANETSDPDNALKLANEILAISEDDEERLLVSEIKKMMEQKINSRKRRLYYWGAAAAVVGVIWISGKVDSKKSEPYYPPPSAAYSSQRKSNSLPRYVPQKTGTNLGNLSKPASISESLPPIGVGRVLSKAQIRYCIYQGVRLEYLRNHTTDNLRVQKFNNVVNDYNSRCSSFRYRAGFLKSVEGEVPAVRSRLELEANKIVASWGLHH